MTKRTKQFIKNSRGEKMFVLSEILSDQKGLAFINHGLGGKHNTSLIDGIAKSFLREGYSVIRHDARNSMGKSDGDYSQATVTQFLEDLNTVINWAENQSFFTTPFVLAGHSLGGITVGLYAERHPENVKALVPIASTISGKLSLEAHGQESIAGWKETGWLIRESRSQPGLIKKLKWQHMEDRLKYDLLKNVSVLEMPVFMAVGTLDDRTPVEHNQAFFKALRGPKEIHIIELASHAFSEKGKLKEVCQKLQSWIRSNL